MQSKQELPQGYAEILHIDLQKDKKAALRVNGLALLITAVCIAVGLCIVPFAAFYKVGSYAAFAVKLAALGGGSVLYIIARSLGKYYGSKVSCLLTKQPKPITDYLGITLLPQAGVALGMALTATALSDGALVRNVVLFSVLVYELVGPALTKRSLLLAGEIHTEGKTSSRVTDTPREHISIH